MLGSSRRSSWPRGDRGTWHSSARLLGLLLWGLALPWSAVVAHAQSQAPGNGPDEPSVWHPLRATVSRVTPPARGGDLVRRRFESELRVRERLGPHGVSQKARQARTRRLAKLRSGEISADTPETLRVLLVRIAFREDRTGPLTSVTLDGDFVFTDPDSLYPFDPAPHDKAYFEAHLRGLAEYWTAMSDRRLVIDARVLPEGDRDAYYLEDIADYGPCPESDPPIDVDSVSGVLDAQKGCPDAFWTLDGLVALVQDMIKATDAGTQADQSVNLADYDFDDPNTYIIFAHAGGDLQSNLVWDSTQEGYSPNDIPTFNVLLGDDHDVDLTSLDSETGQPGRVTECSVIPESTTQDGLLGSIASGLYHEFGHALGLPDLYDTYTGLPTVGFWDIMDSGTNLTAAVQKEVGGKVYEVVGLLPPSTSAWCKWYLGWIDPVVVGSRPQDLRLWPTHLQNLSPDERKIALIDVSSDEFFLLENRYVSPSAAGLVLQSDPATGVVLYLARDQGTVMLPNSYQYDFYMPWGGGLLLWRVREDVIDQGMLTNTVQMDPDARGLELIEADGIQDIGVYDFTTIGFVGSDTDAFRDESRYDVGLDEPVVYPRTAVEITPTTTPSTASSFRIPTGVSLTGISSAPANEFEPMEAHAVIEGLVAREGSLAQFPVRLPRALGAGGGEVPMRGDPESVGFAGFDAGPSIVVSAQAADGSGAPGLYAYDFTGAPRFAGHERIAELSARLAGPPLWIEQFQGGPAPQPALVTVTVDGVVDAFAATGVVPGDDQASELWGAGLADSVDVRPVFVRTADRGYVIATNLERGLLQVVDEDGAILDWSGHFPIDSSNPLRSAPIAADLEASGRADKLVFVGGAMLQGTEVSGQTVDGFPVAFPSSFSSEPGERFWLLAWPQPPGRSGSDRIVVVAEDLRGDAFGIVMRAEPDEAGRWSTRYFGRLLSSPPTADPALGDLDGDGRLELLIVTRDRLWVRNDTGVDVTGFPLRLTDQHLHGDSDDGPGSTPLVADVDGDGLNEAVVISRGGLVYAFDYDGKLARGFPRRPAGPETPAPLLVDVDLGSGPRRALVLFEALGDTLAPLGGSLTPSRQSRSARLTALDLGPSPVDPAEERPAEWVGRGGGPARSYRGVTGARAAVATGVQALQDTPATIYPNPIRFDLSARARFYSGQDQTARITIYNLEGERVLTAEQFNHGGVAGEVAWNPYTLVPGAYVCKLEYVGKSGPAIDLLPLYVER